MATYKYNQYLIKVDHAAFDAIHKPSAETPFSGIYRCMGCDTEIVSEKSRPLPPQNHHQHTLEQGEIRWRLVTYADHKHKQ